MDPLPKDPLSMDISINNKISNLSMDIIDKSITNEYFH